MDKQIEITKIAWLAGLIDGEGSIGFYKSNDKRGKNRGTHQKNLSITNGDWNLIEEVGRVLEAILGHPPCIVFDRRRDRKHVYPTVRLHKREDIIKALTVIEPFLVGKKIQARLLLKMLSQHQRYTKYTPEEKACIERLKKLKSIGYLTVEEFDNAELSGVIKVPPKCVETINLAPQLVFWGDDIVQTPAKAEDNSVSA